MQFILRELMTSIEKMDRIYTWFDLLFEPGNTFSIIHQLSTSDSRGRLGTDDAAQLKKFRESHQEAMDIAKKKKDAEAAAAAAKARYNNQGRGSNQRGNNRGANEETGGATRGGCYICGLTNHKAINCKKNKPKN